MPYRSPYGQREALNWLWENRMALLNLVTAVLAVVHRLAIWRRGKTPTKKSSGGVSLKS